MMEKRLLSKKLKLWYAFMLCALVGVPSLLAQDVLFTSVNPTSDVLTITNPGAATVDVTNYWLCTGPGTYVRVGTITPNSGTYSLSPGANIELSYSMMDAVDGLSLYSTNAGFGDPANIVSFVQWGAASQARADVAVSAGIWGAESDFISGTGTYSTTTGGSSAAWTVCDVEGGAIQIMGTTDTATTICTGEGTDDLIAVEFVDDTVLSGDESTWVITDQATGDILGAPAAGPFNLEGAPSGVCDIWYLRYTGDIGLGTATNVSQLMGCFDLSNPISVTRTGVNGGAIQIAGTTDTATTICTGEGTDDLIAVEFVDDTVLDGDESTWVITDQATGDILGAPAAGPFNLEGAPSGVCDIWYLRYTGDIGLGTATNVSQLSGCFDLSNPISVTRTGVNAGAIQIAGTTDTATTICTGEGTDDLIAVEFVDDTVLDGDESTWVITDQATGDILGAPAAGPFNLEGAPSGICDIWYLRYTGDIGLGTATNVSQLSGCFDLSNPISVTRTGVNGGAIQIAGTTDTATTICTGEGTDDLIAVEFVDDTVLDGDSSTWVITDQATGDILGAPAAGPFNLEGAPSGVCDIWYLRYTGDIGLGTATNVSQLSGCFDLSNPISVTRTGVNAGAIQIAGTTDTATTICTGEGTDDLIAVEFVDDTVLDGDESTWVITDQATGDILGAPAAGPFNLEGAPSGVCDIWYLRYTGDIGLGTATNVSQLSGCFDLSNPISVTRNGVNGGEIKIAGTSDTEGSICVGEGTDDLIAVEFVDDTVLDGDSSTWVITDQATGDILGAPAAGPFNLETAPAGICDIWYLRYTGDIGLGTATNVSQLSGCFDLSNPISITRFTGMDCDDICDAQGGAIQIAGTTDTATTICTGEGTDDLIAVEFVDDTVLVGDSSTWVITDQATGDILGAPAAGPFNLEGAPSGVCDIWYLRYTGDIGLGTATNVSQLMGCFDLSNPISVTRTGVNAGAIQIAGTTDTATTICTGEGTDDLIAVEFVDDTVLDGDESTWVITDQATGDILGAPAAGPFNLEGAPSGVCDIWYLRYTGDIGLGTATNVSQLSGCFDLSNPISVTRTGVNGGAIQIAGTTDVAKSICVGEGTDDLIAVEFVDDTVLDGDSSTWVITDQATGDILGAPAAGPFNLETAPAGICDIWYLRYTGDIGLGTATNVSQLSGCFDLSNPISITRLTGTDCDILSTDDIDQLSFNLYPNPAKGKLNINFNNSLANVGISIYDLSGRVVLNKSYSNQNKVEIDLSDLSNGTYLVNIKDEETNDSAVRRIIKN